MLKLLRRIRQWFRRQPPAPGLTVIKYEAVSLIAYEGRAAYERAREQAEYCLSQGSEAGCRFWSDVAIEVARRTGMGGVAIWTGALREDVYRPAPSGGFEPPPGIFRKLERQGTLPLVLAGWTLTDRDGMRQIFERPPAWPFSDRLPLVRVEDRYGNPHHLSYDVEGRLEKVEDGAGRFLRFSYGDCGLLELVEDHTGRAFQYLHDPEAEHLVAVVMPATPEYPEGLIHRYEYDRDRTHPALLHNMVRVLDPAGQLVVENEYGDDPMSEDFGRIVRQVFGGFEATFHATRLALVPRVPEASNVPAVQVESIDPGVLRVHTFNYRGDLLDERFRLVADGSFRIVARSYRYDAQGNVIDVRESNGLGTLLTYDYENSDPRARGNLLRMERVAPPSRPAPSRLVRRSTYEPQFHREKTRTDEEGNVTTYVYDYEVGTGTFGDIVRIEYPIATLPDGTLQPRAEHFRTNTAGQLIEHVTGAGHETSMEYYATGLVAGYLSRIVQDVSGAAIERHFEYDALGRRTATLDGLGRRLETEFNQLDQIVRERFPAINGTADEVHIFYDRAGQVRREELPRGEYDDGVITDPFLAHEYAYDCLGHRIRADFGVNTGSPRSYEFLPDDEDRPLRLRNPIGVTTVLRYDERGLLLSRTDAAGLLEEATWRYIYDRNGNRTAVIDPVGHRVDYEYDSWDRLRRIIQHGAPEAQRARIELTLDAFDRATRTLVSGLTGPGTVGVLADIETHYDERGRPWRRSLDGTSTIFFHDPDERMVRAVDVRGSTFTTDYNGLGRAIRSADAAGNEEIRSFDAVGNIIAIETREAGPGGITESLTSLFVYDERNRLILRTSPLGNAERIEYDARNLAVREISPAGSIVRRTFGLEGELLSLEQEVEPGVVAFHRFDHDLLGRMTAYTDPGGSVTRRVWDARDRLVSIIDPNGSTTRYTYGGRIQPEREQLPDGTGLSYFYRADGSVERIDFAPGPGIAATPSQIFGYDGLRRLIKAEQGGTVLERTYDSRMRLTSETCSGRTTSMAFDDVSGTARLIYPDGRTDRFELDALGRMATLTLETSGNAGLAGLPATGTRISEWTYHGTRPAGRELYNGLRYEVRFDADRRLSALVHSDGNGTELLALRYLNDRDSFCRVRWAAPVPQQSVRYDYDRLGRLRAAARGVAVSEPPNNPSQAVADAAIAATGALTATMTERFTVNLADARVLREREEGGVTISEATALDPAWRVTQLTRTGPAPGSTAFSFDAAGRCTSDDRHQFRYDALGRLVEVQDLNGAVQMRLEYDPVGRLLRRWEGAKETRIVHFGSWRIQEEEGAGAVFIQRTPGLGVDETVMESTGDVLHPLEDFSRTIHARAGSTGEVLERYRFEPFGTPSIWAPDGVTQRIGSVIGAVPQFGGHPVLSTDLYDARTRVYDSATGRFLQPDPHGLADGPNPYVYCHHEPVGHYDPTGEIGIILTVVVVVGGGMVAGASINAVHQGLAMWDDPEREWDWGELGWSTLGGGVMAPLLVAAPELLPVFAGLGAYSGVQEMREGHWRSGIFDTAISVLPFASSKGRGTVKGAGRLFGQVFGIGLGPADGLAARVSRFHMGPAWQPPGVSVRQTTFGGAPAWEKSVSTKIPILRAWAELTIRKQEAALRTLESKGIQTPTIFQSYKPGGSLILEHAGRSAKEAMTEFPELKGAYKEFLDAAKKAMHPWAGSGWRAKLNLYKFPKLDDLNSRNIGFRFDRGKFVAFDPAIDPITYAVGGGFFLGVLSAALASQVPRGKK